MTGPSRRAPLTRLLALADAHRPLAAMPARHAATAAAFARLLDRLPPGLAEEYVLPWAGGTPRIDRLCTAVTSAPLSPARPAGRPGHLTVLYHEAMRQAWRDGAGLGGPMFEDAARRAVAGLTGDNAPDSLAVLASARPVDTTLAARLLAALARQDVGTARVGRQAAHRWLPFLASTVRSCGGHVPACPAVPGIAVGRLIRCGRDGHAPARHEGAILLVDRPLPAQAPLLLAARGVIARAAGPQPAGAGRSVPTVTGCQPEFVTGRHVTDGSWLAAIDGSTGEVALLPR